METEGVRKLPTVELQDLRWAIVASQHRSLRQAAETLNIRQSTLSRGLRDLEYRLGAVLFVRTSGGTHPTAAGLEFLETARRIVDDTDAAFSRLKTHYHGESGRLTIGVYTSFATGNLRATLMEHLHRFPEVEVHTVDGARNHLLSDLAANAADVAIVTTIGTNWNDRTLPLWSERVVAALPEHHHLSANRVIHWADLRDEPLLFAQRDPGLIFLHLLLTKLGCQGNPRMMPQEVGLDRLLSLVGTGLGLTLVSEGATGAAYSGVAYREVHDSNGPERLHFMACWREANDNPTLVPFLALLRERYPDLTAPSDAADI
jgi:DNA-binding transcriptional LysR family regulator